MPVCFWYYTLVKRTTSWTTEVQFYIKLTAPQTKGQKIKEKSVSRKVHAIYEEPFDALFNCRMIINGSASAVQCCLLVLQTWVLPS